MVMSSACSRACRVCSPLAEAALGLKVSERSNSLYRRVSELARDLMRSHAWVEVQARDVETSRMYILRILEALCSIISRTASVKIY